MPDELRRIGNQMANVMYQLAQRPGEALTPQVAAVMDDLRRQWDAAAAAAPVLVGHVTDVKTVEYAARLQSCATITCALNVRSTELWQPGRLWLLDPSHLRMPTGCAS